MRNKRLIDANALLESIEGTDWYTINYKGDATQGAPCEEVAWYKARDIYSAIENAPTVDAVSRGVHDQVRWELDIAMKQLEEHGIPFGGIAPDVVKVVRCRDCRYWRDGVDGCTDHVKCCAIGLYMIDEHGYCSVGKRKEDLNERKAD
jgi:hypothetical protein